MKFFTDNMDKIDDKTNKDIQSHVMLCSITSDFCAMYTSYNSNYTAKLIEALSEYKYIRPMKKDGNCFYRAVLVGIIEKINSNANKYLEKYVSLANKYFNDIISKGYPQITVSDFFEIFIQLLNNIPRIDFKHVNGNKPKTLEEYINETMQDSEVCNYSIVFMRLVLSCYLQNNSSIYESFLTDGMNIETFCKNEVEPVEMYCDNIQIDALVKIFEINISITSVSPNACFTFNNPSDATSVDLHLLYNNSHYDILYK